MSRSIRSSGPPGANDCRLSRPQRAASVSGSALPSVAHLPNGWKSFPQNGMGDAGVEVPRHRLERRRRTQERLRSGQRPQGLATTRADPEHPDPGCIDLQQSGQVGGIGLDGRLVVVQPDRPVHTVIAAFTQRDLNRRGPKAVAAQFGPSPPLSVAGRTGPGAALHSPRLANRSSRPGTAGPQRGTRG
jgi:hypothetical protein